MLKNEITVVGDQCEKQREAKEVILTLNTAYKKQIDLVREESRLRLEEEQAKRSENMGGYNSTMTDLSNLLETHTAQNSRLRDQNAQMASKMGGLNFFWTIYFFHRYICQVSWWVRLRRGTRW